MLELLKNEDFLFSFWLLDREIRNLKILLWAMVTSYYIYQFIDQATYSGFIQKLVIKSVVGSISTAAVAVRVDKNNSSQHFKVAMALGLSSCLKRFGASGLWTQQEWMVPFVTGSKARPQHLEHTISYYNFNPMNTLYSMLFI